MDVHDDIIRSIGVHGNTVASGTELSLFISLLLHKTTLILKFSQTHTACKECRCIPSICSRLYYIPPFASPFLSLTTCKPTGGFDHQLKVFPVEWLHPSVPSRPSPSFSHNAGDVISCVSWRTSHCVVCTTDGGRVVMADTRKKGGRAPVDMDTNKQVKRGWVG